jgi:hypothetical protein
VKRKRSSRTASRLAGPKVKRAPRVDAEGQEDAPSPGVGPLEGAAGTAEIGIAGSPHFGDLCRLELERFDGDGGLPRSLGQAG